LPTEKELLEAVLTNPRDDAPRLVYADWLSERGDPRGELIALHIKDPARPANLERWSGCLPSMKPDIVDWRFERGFVGGIRARRWRWLDRAAAIFGEHPVERLEIENLEHDNREGLAALAAAPWLGRIRKLLLSGGQGSLRGRELAVLAKAPGLAIEDLWIRMPPDLAAARILARWKGLRALSVSTGRLVRGPALAIARSPALATVEHLGISSLRTFEESAELVATLVKNRRIGAVTRLHLGGNRLEGPSLRLLLERFPSLRQLGLSSADLTNSKARTLASLPGLASVRVLGLGRNRIGDEGARALAASPHLGDLEELSIGENPIGARGRAALTERFGKRVSFA
jgi:uncharacterized protein (TIGR02996 family)